MIAFVWTTEEAELAWKERRIDFNLALTIPENAKSVYRRDGFLVDGMPATIHICSNESAKRAVLKAQQLASEPEGIERQKWAKFPPDPQPIEGKTCRVCGGKLVLVILNYFRDRDPDVFTPADKAEKCLSCGRSFVVEFHQQRTA
jgi:hypothetical protein